MPDELEKLRAFYKEVARLTLNHDVMSDFAVVWPKDLGAALEKVNPEWWREEPEQPSQFDPDRSLAAQDYGDPDDVDRTF